jgi:hypothetical protein
MSKPRIPKLPRLPAALQRKLKFDLKEIDKKSPLDGSHLAWRDSVDRRKEALNKFRVGRSDESRSGLFDRFTDREISTPAEWEALINDPDTIDFVGFKEVLNYVVLTYIAVEDAYILEWKQTNKSSYEQLEKLLLLIKAEAIRRGLKKCGYGEDWFNRRVLPYANAEIDARIENRRNWARDVEKHRLTEAAAASVKRKKGKPPKTRISQTPAESTIEAPTEPPRQDLPVMARRTVWEGLPPPLDILPLPAVEPIRTELPSGRQIPPISERLASSPPSSGLVHDPISEDVLPVDPQSPPSSAPEPLMASDEQPTPSEPDKPQESPSNALPPSVPQLPPPEPEEIIEDRSAPVAPPNGEVPSPPGASPVAVASLEASSSEPTEASAPTVESSDGAEADFGTSIEDPLRAEKIAEPTEEPIAEPIGASPTVTDTTPVPPPTSEPSPAKAPPSGAVPVEADSGTEVVDESADPVESQPSLDFRAEPSAMDYRAIVDAFIDKVLADTGTRITRKNIYNVGGYKDQTEFLKFQRGECSGDASHPET